MKTPFGKYDHLSDDQRRRLARFTGLQAAAWMLGVVALGWLDRRYGWSAGSSAVELLLGVVCLGMAVRGMILLVRSIAIQSPNPKRSPPKS
jgi:hypothetical protein